MATLLARFPQQLVASCRAYSAPAKVSMELIKELRGMTGAGVADVKKALEENNMDMQAAMEWLRKKGLAAAAKRAGRAASEGLISVATNTSTATLVELNCETDFVARNEAFRGLSLHISQNILDKVHGKDSRDVISEYGVEEVLQWNTSAGKFGTLATPVQSMKQTIIDVAAACKENVQLRRVGVLTVKCGVVGTYVHNRVDPNESAGRLSAAVALVIPQLEASGPNRDAAVSLASQLAMQVAALNPSFVDEASVSKDMIEKERSIIREQAQSNNVKATVMDKYVEGNLKKFFAENCLMNQSFVVDQNKKVSKVIEELSKKVSSPVTVAGFLRYEVGQQ